MIIFHRSHIKADFHTIGVYPGLATEKTSLQKAPHPICRSEWQLKQLRRIYQNIMKFKHCVYLFLYCIPCPVLFCTVYTSMLITNEPGRVLTLFAPVTTLLSRWLVLKGISFRYIDSWRWLKKWATVDIVSCIGGNTFLQQIRSTTTKMKII